MAKQKNEQMNRISSWHIFISGATQNRQQSTGLQLAWLSAKTNAHKSNPINTSSICFFPVLPWNYDWYTLARFIQINSIKEEGLANPPLINIYAYSWGAGWGAIQLASYLMKVGGPEYQVQNMVLADPVYCSSNPFLRWKALFASRFSFTKRFAPSITIPSNTNNVFWSRQYNSWPRAHSLNRNFGTKTKIHSPQLELTLSHSEMDDSPWFQNKVSLLASGSSVA